MPSHAWSLPPRTACCVFMRFRCTLLRFMGTFYSIRTVLSSYLSRIPCFHPFPPFALTLPPPYYYRSYSLSLSPFRCRFSLPPHFQLSLASCLSPARMPTPLSPCPEDAH